MNETDIIIPSCKPVNELVQLIKEIERKSSGNFQIILVSNPDFSASQNRNAGLLISTAPYVIMVDDDITGFYPAWNEILIWPLKTTPHISIVSARLVRKDGTPAPMMSSQYALTADFEEVKKVPTACVAFRQTIIRFDENFKGSGFEDDAFCLAMGPQITIYNRVKLIHLNEMKHQQEHWEHNKRHFEETYANRPV